MTETKMESMEESLTITILHDRLPMEVRTSNRMRNRIRDLQIDHDHVPLPREAEIFRVGDLVKPWEAKKKFQKSWKFKYNDVIQGTAVNLHTECLLKPDWIATLEMKITHSNMETNSVPQLPDLGNRLFSCGYMMSRLCMPRHVRDLSLRHFLSLTDSRPMVEDSGVTDRGNRRIQRVSKFLYVAATWDNTPQYLFCLAMNIAFKQIWELGCETWPNVSELVLLKTGPRSLSKGYEREAEGVFVICHLVDWIICRQLQGFRGKQQG
ncbi:hypothetical protein F2Q68_00042298 [Brassica cretica]|uniref:Uncharacterized protein n=1 Tax=Brassica cretica TaxID=69181 RepID=A0A8S9MQI6_BRACR|nr:hypothetical protein F2Q68_00042298 [Brassica cretica]